MSVFGRIWEKVWLLTKRGDSLPELLLCRASQERLSEAVKTTIALKIILDAICTRLQRLQNCNCLIFTLDLDFDRPGPWVRSRLERLHCILQLETMGHQLLHIDDTVLHKSNGSWPGIAVSVLKL